MVFRLWRCLCLAQNKTKCFFAQIFSVALIYLDYSFQRFSFPFEFELQVKESIISDASTWA